MRGYGSKLKPKNIPNILKDKGGKKWMNVIFCLLCSPPHMFIVLIMRKTKYCAKTYFAQTSD